jgi:phytoene dehydrogenase-like protein
VGLTPPEGRPGLTRREALVGAAVAGLAAGLVGCGSRRHVSGRIVEGHEAAAHRLLRDGGPLPHPGSREDVPVLIVGGGVAGLAAAWTLARAGVTGVPLLELEAAVGGTAAWEEGPVVPHPWGAHYVPLPTREQRALCALLLEMGVIDGFDAAGRALAREDALCRAPEERLFHRGRWSEGLYLLDGASADDVAQLERFQAETAALAARVGSDGRRAFALPLAASSQDEDLLALDRISMARWLAERGFSSPRLLWFVEYACRDDFGAALDETSAWAGLHYFAARRAGPDADAAPVLTWPEGNGRLVTHMLAASRPALRTGALVVGVEPAQDRALVRWVDLGSGVLRETVAEHVILAVPRFAAARLLPALAADRAEFVHGPWAVANLVLERRPRSHGFPQAWDNVLVESDSLGYVVANHQADRASLAEVWTWYRPYPGPDVVAARRAMLDAPWSAWRDEIVRDLVRAHPDLEDCLVSIDVRRWGHAMVRPRPGFVWGAARRRALEPLGRVRFAGCDVAGLPLFEEAQWSGVRAAEDVLGALGRSFESLL